MKKNNEGYVLAMVMSVVAVLALIASAMLSIGLRNVQTQQAAIDRMQSRYNAEGSIEKAVAVFSAVEVAGKSTEQEAEATFFEELTKAHQAYESGEGVIITQPEPVSGGIYAITICAQTGTITIDTKIELISESEEVWEYIKKEGSEEGNGSELNKHATYGVKVKAVRYDSYEISTTTVGGGA